MRLYGVVLLLVAPALAAAADTAAPPLRDAAAVIECMRGNIPQTVRIQEVSLVAFDRGGGSRELRARLFGKRDGERVNLMLRIDAPPDLAGASYLVREQANGDDMYVYLPALNRVRRILGSSADSPLFGTDLSYADVKQIQNAFDGGNVALAGQGQVGGRTTYRLSMKPTTADQTRYERIDTEVDTQTCVALRAEFYEAGQLRKRLDADPESLQQADGHWYAADAEMSDVQAGTRTTLKVIGVTSGARLSATLFNPKTFYIGG